MTTALSDILSGSKSAATSGTSSTSAAPAEKTAATAPATTDVKPAPSAPAEIAAAASSAAKADVKTATVAEKAAPAEKAGEETQAQKDERTRNEKGQFTKVDEEIAGLKKAAAEERRKRQELETKLRDRETAAPKKTEEEASKTDFWADPETALKERMDPELRRLSEKHESELFALYEDLAKTRYADYDEVVDALVADAKDDPKLAQQLNLRITSERNKPAFLYNFALQQRELKESGGDLIKYKEKVTSELNTQLSTVNASLKERDAEIARLKAQLDNVAKVPTSLNTEQSTAAGAARSTERTPLSEIVKPKKRRA